MKHYNIPIFVPHAGCPHDCVFCNQKKITGHTSELDLADVKDYIELLLEDIHLKTYEKHVEIAFFGGSFTGIPIAEQEALLKLAYGYKTSGLIDGIRLSTRPDYIDKNILDMLKAYGVTTIELGVQSLDQKVIDLSKRGHSFSDVITSAELIRTYGFCLGLQMMIGLPGDTEKIMLETVQKIIELKPDCVRIYPTLVIVDTALEVLYNNGDYTPLSIEEAVYLASLAKKQFDLNEIKVIRIGLQPSEELENGAVIAGPYHPAFRQLVESQSYLSSILKALGEKKLESLEIGVKSQAISDVVGQKKSNIKMLKKHFGLKVINVRPLDLEADELALIYDGKTHIIRK